MPNKPKTAETIIENDPDIAPAELTDEERELVAQPE